MHTETKLIGMDLEKSGTHHDLVISRITYIDSSRGMVGGGLSGSFGGIYLGIIRHGGFVFNPLSPLYKEYFGEKLSLTSDAVDDIFDLFNFKEGENTYGDFYNI